MRSAVTIAPYIKAEMLRELTFQLLRCFAAWLVAKIVLNMSLAFFT